MGTTAKDFVSKGLEKGYNRDQIKSAMDKYLSTGGKFDDVPNAVAGPAATPAPSKPTEPPAQQPAPAAEKPGIMQTLFPGTVASTNSGGGFLSRAVAGSGDALTMLPRAAIGAAAGAGTLAGGGSLSQAAQAGAEEMGKAKATQGGASGFVENIARDPATYMPGAGAMKGVSIGGRLIRGGLAGLAQAGTSAAYQQATEGQIKPGQTAAQGAMGFGLGALSEAAPAAIGAAKTLAGKDGWFTRQVKDVFSSFSGVKKQTLEQLSNPAEMARIKALAEQGQEGRSAFVSEVQSQSDNINKTRQETAAAKIAEINAALDKKIKGASDEAQAALDAAIARGQGKSASGEALKGNIIAARKGAGETFAKGEAGYLAPEISAKQMAGAGERLAGAGGKVLTESGVIGDSFANAKIGGQPMLESQIKDIKYFQGLATEAQTVGDMITQLRRVRAMKGAPKDGGGFYDSAALGLLDKEYKNVIKKELESMEKAGAGEGLAAAWEANNKYYSESMAALQNVKGELGRINKSGETFVDKVQSMGVEGTIKMKAAVADHPELAPLWDSINESFRDGLISKSTRPDGSIDYKALRKSWDAIERNRPGLRAVVLGDEAAATIDGALAKYDQAQAGILAEKGTAEARAKSIAGIAKENKFGRNLEGRGGETGIINVGNDTPKSRAVLDELELLDALTGREGPESFVQIAKDFSAAKSTGMLTNGGNLPTAPIITTGKAAAGSTAGALIGQAIKWAPRAVGGAIGGTAGYQSGGGYGGGAGGAFVGALLGSRAQSPAAAVAVYKLLNSATARSATGAALRMGLGAGVGVGVAAATGEDKALGAIAGAGLGAVGPAALRGMKKNRTSMYIK
jgi:hypothetical protein